MVDSKATVAEGLDGLPYPKLRCPYPEDAAENHMTDAGEHVAVYEAQVAANGNDGWNGDDGFPFCCACGEERSDHKLVEVSRAEEERR